MTDKQKYLVRGSHFFLQSTASLSTGWFNNSNSSQPCEKEIQLFDATTLDTLNRLVRRYWNGVQRPVSRRSDGN